MMHLLDGNKVFIESFHEEIRLKNKEMRQKGQNCTM